MGSVKGKKDRNKLVPKIDEQDNLFTILLTQGRRPHKSPQEPDQTFRRKKPAARAFHKLN
jgi:hypothetical protein